jgi:hypothetical protein
MTGRRIRSGTLLAACIAALSAPAIGGGIVVHRVQGDVTVRHGVTEAWAHVAVGDVLRPDDSMKTGIRGSAILEVFRDREGAEAKRITLPPEVIVEMSDIRDLSQEELMLKLTMEKVRSSPYRWDGTDPVLPDAIVVHGGEKGDSRTPAENDPAIGVLQVNGSRVLLANGFYSTCVLRMMEVFRMFPGLAGRFENRVLLAEALERSQLRGEALAEYGSISSMPGLSPGQLETVRSRMAALRR